MNDSPHASLKQCAGECKQFLPATPEVFSRNKTRKDGLQPICKACTKAYKKQHYQTHKAEISEKHKAYRETHKEQVAERARRYQQETHREKHLDYHKQYYANHKEQMLEQMKQHYQVHGERIRSRVKRYQDTHKELISERSKQYRKTHKQQIDAQRKRAYSARREYLLAQKKRHYSAHKELYRESQKRWRKTERGRIIRRALWHKREAQKKAIGGSYTAQDIQMQRQRQRDKCYWCHKKLQQYHIDHVIPLSRGGANDPSNLVIACPHCNTSRKARLPHEWPEGNRLL